MIDFVMPLNPVVSIIIPTRDRPILLSRALQAMRGQTFSDFEVLVIDDGSSAASRAEYAAMWKGGDERFKLELLGVDGQKGVGPAAARNYGISLARGEVLAFCDDDDFWTDPCHLQMAVAVLAEDPRADLYIASQRACEASGGVRSVEWLPGLTAQIADKHREEGGLVSVQQLVRCGGFAHLNILLLRKALARRIGGFWERTVYEEDRDFFWRAVDAADRIFYSPKVIAQHNIPDPGLRNNVTTQQTKVDRWLLSILVSQHISLEAHNPLIISLARGYEGDILRRLAEHFVAHGDHSAAFYFAKRALAARFSFKWLGYTGVLGVRSLMGGVV